MSKPSPPAAPDPTATIAAQSASNTQSALQNAELNRVNQTTPYGSSNWTITGTNPDGTPQYAQNVSLSQPEQGLFNTATSGAQQLGNTALGLLGNVQQSYTQPFGATSPQQMGQQQQNAAYKEQTQYLDPQFAQGQEQITQQLANQGLTPGTEAYNNAMTNFNNAKQAAYSNAQNQSIGLGNAAENQYYGQALTNYNQPLNTYNALMSGAQVQNPNFTGVPSANVATTNASGIINQGYQNQLAAYNAQQQGSNNLISAGGGLLGAAITGNPWGMFS